MGSRNTAKTASKERRRPDEKVIPLDNQGKRDSRPLEGKGVANRHVFISHKSKEEAIAKSIVRELKPFGAGMLSFFLSEDIPKGEEWATSVHNHLKAADYLILLYTDPEARWDWCLYETGYFMGYRDESEKKLICLHSSDVPTPGPLNAWQSVKAWEEDLVKFIAQILDFNPALIDDKERVSEIARKIARLFLPQRLQRVFFTNPIDLVLNDAQFASLKLDGILASEVKVKGDKQALSLFELTPKLDGTDWTWGEFSQKILRNENNIWTDSLADSVARAVNNEEICAGLPLFVSPSDNKTYCPVLSAFEVAGGEHTFKLDFVEVRDENDLATDGRIAPIANLMKLSQRVRFGFIELCRSQVRDLCRGDADNQEIDKVLGGLKSKMQKLSAEARMLRIFGKENVTSAFSDPKDREAVDRMTQEWRMMRDRLFQDYIPQRNLDGVLEVLDVMRQMNREFLLMVSRREHELLLEME